MRSSIFQWLKTIKTTAYVVFFLGLIIRFLNFPSHTLLMVIGLGTLIFFGFVDLAHHRIRSTFNLVICAWMLALLFTVKFLPLTGWVVGFAVGFSLIFLFKKRRIRKLKYFLPIFSVFAMVLVLQSLPKHNRFYLVSVHWNYKIDRDYRTWDKYAWFLYQNGIYRRAEEAAEEAIQIAEVRATPTWQSKIRNHQAAIEDRTWKSYP